MEKTVWVSVVCLTALFANSKATRKIWVPTTLLTDPRNWARGEYPKPCDGLQLQNAIDLTVQLPSQMLKEILSVRLPRRGVLTVAKDASINFIDPRKCIGYKPKAEFLRTNVKSWLDPNNWMQEKSPLNNGWIPHRNRIPCAGDEVVFPEQPDPKTTSMSLTVLLPSVLVPIGPMYISNLSLTATEWTDYLQSEKGSEYFKGPADVHALEWRSDSGSGKEKNSYCGRGSYVIRDWSFISVDSKILDEAVCMYAKPRCELEAILCDSPIYPDGHCCGVCGALVNIYDDTDDGIPLIHVANIVKNLLKESGYDVLFHVARLPTESIQVTIISKNGDPTESYDLAHSISSYLHREHGFTSVSLVTSGWSKQFSPVSNMLGTLFGALFFVIFLFGCIYSLVTVLPKQKWLQLNKRDPFTFARFQNTLQEEVSVEHLVLEAGGPTSESFANPLYGAESIDRQPFVGGSVFPPKEDSGQSIQLVDIQEKASQLKDDSKQDSDPALIDSGPTHSPEVTDPEKEWESTEDDVGFTELLEQSESHADE